MRIEAPPRLLAAAERAARVRTSGVLTAMLALGAIVDPNRPLPIDLCVLKAWTGLSCPTCGLTRAVCHALQGDWVASIGFHPAGLLVLVTTTGWIGWSALEAWSGQPIWARGRRIAAQLAGVAIGGTTLISWLMR